MCFNAMAGAPQDGCSYKDILILGKTGMGKSTTADRLLIANSRPGTLDVNPEEKEGGNTLLDDILIWRTSTKSVEDIKERVKFFLVNRAGQLSAFQAIDPQSGGPDSVTKDCVLLSNEKTHIRVLDVPGFHTSSPTLTSPETEQTAKQENLSIMRQILRIQSIKQLRFYRVLYFLPFRNGIGGIRADANFQEELVMHYYFGNRIFDSMVVIATLPLMCSKSNAFTSQHEANARKVLNRAFQFVFARLTNRNPDDISLDNVPQPPIFYISVEDSGTEIFGRLQLTKVKVNRLELRLDENTCARCSIKFGVYHINNNHATPLVAINNGQRSAYDQSKCHPLIKPKHSKLKKIVGGIAYILLLGIPALAGSPWPGFFNDEEECAHCKNPPGSPGCLKVGTEWKVHVKEDIMKVDHSNDLDDFQVVVEQ